MICFLIDDSLVTHKRLRCCNLQFNFKSMPNFHVLNIYYYKLGVSPAPLRCAAAALFAVSFFAALQKDAAAIADANPAEFRYGQYYEMHWSN